MMATPPPEFGVKHDGFKLDWSFLPPEVIEEALKVYAMGAKKYGRANYLKGIAYSRLFSAAMRHLWAWWRGEEKDEESGLSHLSHALWNVMSLLEFTLGRSGGYQKWDDRKTANCPPGMAVLEHYSSKDEVMTKEVLTPTGICTHDYEWSGSYDVEENRILINLICRFCGDEVKRIFMKNAFFRKEGS